MEFDRQVIWTENADTTDAASRSIYTQANNALPAAIVREEQEDCHISGSDIPAQSESKNQAEFSMTSFENWFPEDNDVFDFVRDVSGLDWPASHPPSAEFANKIKDEWFARNSDTVKDLYKHTVDSGIQIRSWRDVFQYSYSSLFWDVPSVDDAYLNMLYDLYPDLPNDNDGIFGDCRTQTSGTPAFVKPSDVTPFPAYQQNTICSKCQEKGSHMYYAGCGFRTHLTCVGVDSAPGGYRSPSQTSQPNPGPSDEPEAGPSDHILEWFVQHYTAPDPPAEEIEKLTQESGHSTSTVIAMVDALRHLYSSSPYRLYSQLRRHGNKVTLSHVKQTIASWSSTKHPTPVPDSAPMPGPAHPSTPEPNSLESCASELSSPATICGYVGRKGLPCQRPCSRDRCPWHRQERTVRQKLRAFGGVEMSDSELAQAFYTDTKSVPFDAVYSPRIRRRRPQDEKAEIREAKRHLATVYSFLDSDEDDEVA